MRSCEASSIVVIFLLSRVFMVQLSVPYVKAGLFCVLQELNWNGVLSYHMKKEQTLPRAILSFKITSCSGSKENRFC